MQVYIPLIKADEATRTVYGRATQEMVDRDGEVMDYATSKPNFMSWSSDVFNDSGGLSLGNVRSMHGNVCAGKLVDIKYNDGEKAIDVVAQIVDDNEWKKVMEGCLSGFSIGGRYTKKWPDNVNGQMVTRYTAFPSEISIVDRPCVPTAKFLTIQKADGKVSFVQFREAPVKTQLDVFKAIFKGARKPKLTPAQVHAMTVTSLGNASVEEQDAPDLGDVDPAKHREIDEPLDVTKVFKQIHRTPQHLTRSGTLTKAVKFPPESSNGVSGGEIADTGGTPVRAGELGVPDQRVSPFGSKRQSPTRGNSKAPADPNDVSGKNSGDQLSVVDAIKQDLTKPRSFL